MNKVLFSTLAMGLLVSPVTFGAVSDADIEELREQLAAMSERLEELAAENAQLRRAQEESASAIADVQADVADDVEVGFGLATGGDDPVSTNQTLGGGGSSKNVALNLAYADWEIMHGLHLVGGKFKNPLFRAGKQALMWDGNWTPEGIAVKFSRDWYFVNAVGTYLESDSRRGNDALSWGAQFGATGEFGGAKLTGGVAYYSIPTQGDTTTVGDPSDPGDYFGNTAVQADGQACGTVPGEGCVYLYDYLLTQVIAEAAFDLGAWPADVRSGEKRAYNRLMLDAQWKWK